MTPSATTHLPPPPLRIEIGGGSSKPYKSIDYLVWDKIPPFAILTGVNGSGKTQLLELLAYKLSGIRSPQYDVAATAVTSSDVFGAGTVVYIPGTNLLTQPNVGVEQIRQIGHQQVRTFLQQGANAQDLSTGSRMAWIDQWLKEKGLAGKSEQEILEKFPSDLSYMLDEADVMSGLAYVFQAHYLKFAQERARSKDWAAVDARLGRAPWDLLNDALEAADFAYRVVSPTETDLHLHYPLMFRRVGLTAPIPPTALSSGEQAIVKLFAWIFHTKNYRRAPKLYLLDEPDAHLHPSLTRQFMSILKDVLVDQYGIRVILSTHSPSTVALAPEGSVFEMFREQPRIVPSPTVSHTVGLLTSGLMVVSKETKFVFVEDEDDVLFYGTIWEILTDVGPSRVPNGVPPTPSVVFLPASIGSGASKQAGGCTVVIKHVEKFDVDPLRELFRGAIDLDDGNTPTDRIRVLGRYSFENYLLDPLVVYASLNEEGQSPVAQGVNISKGDEHLIRNMPQDELQKIADSVLSLVEQNLRLRQFLPTHSALQAVTFTNGVCLQYPNWMFTWRGHDLLSAFQACFGGPRVIQFPKLYKQLRRVRLVPVEVATLMRELQE